MTETKIRITEEPFRKDTSTGKRRWLVKTDKGQMSVWDEDIAAELSEGWSYTEYVVETTQTGNYVNLVAILGQKELPTKKITNPTDDKLASMLTSYAKDLAIAMLQLAPREITPKDFLESIKVDVVKAIAFWHMSFSDSKLLKDIEEEEDANSSN